MKPILAFLLFASAAYPATILQEQSQFAGVFNAPRFKGQTFLAEEPFLQSIGVRLQFVNPRESDATVNLSLFGGRGTGGDLLAKRSIMPTLSLEQHDIVWLDFDLSGVAVAPGETYTFTIQSPSPYWAAHYNQWAYPGGLIDEEFAGRIDYPGGEFLTDRGFRPYQDLTFRVETIPEPGTWLLLLTGLGGLWFWRKRLSFQHHN
jgi:hypothetical protein